MAKKLLLEEINLQLKTKNLQCIKYNNIVTFSEFVCLICNEKFSAKLVSINNYNTRPCRCENKEYYEILDKFNSKEKIGHLSIIKNLEDKRNGKWLVECVCGKKMEIYTNILANKNRPIYSCGCKQYKKHNESPSWKGCGEIRGKYLASVKIGAKSRNLEYNLDKQYLWNLFLQQNRKCIYSGRILSLGNSVLDIKQTASLDRIDSLKGYVEGNVQWVHKDINRMKQEFSEDYFLQTCREIIKNLENKNVS